MSKFLKVLSSVGSAASSVVNPLSTLIGGLSSLFGSKGVSQRDQMKWQEQMLDKQMNFNATQADLNRRFQASEADKSRDWNSIGSQLARAEAAGVNPYALVGTGQYGSAGSSPTPAGSPASVGGSFPQPAPNTSLQRAQAFNAVASGLAEIASAKERGVNTSYLERGMNDMLRKLGHEADSQELLNNFQRVVNKYADRIQRRTADKLFAEIQLISSKDYATFQEITESKARIVNLLAQSGVAKAQAKRELKFIDEFADRYWQSEIARNNAQAAESSQRTVNLSQEHEFNELGLKVARAVNEEEQRVALNELIERGRQAGIMTESMRIQLEKAVKEKDWFTYDKIIQGIAALAGAYGNIAGGRASVMNANTNRMGRHSYRSGVDSRGRSYSESYDDWRQ